MSTPYTPQTPQAIAPTKKPLWKRWWFWLVLVVVVIAIATQASGGSESGGGGDASSTGAPADGPTAGDSPAAPAPADDPLEDGGWLLSDVQATPSQFGTSITGRITNTQDTEDTGIFTLTVFDPAGARVASTQGSANEVGPGETATVTFIGTEDWSPVAGVQYRYELQNDL